MYWERVIDRVSEDLRVVGGRWNYRFMGVEISGDRYTYRPSEDSLLLTYKVLESIIPSEVSYDICTGSGIIAILIATRGGYVVAGDILWEALINAVENSKLNKVSGYIDFILCDGAEALRSDVQGINIFINPPYIPGKPSIKSDLLYLGGEGGVETAMKILSDLNRVDKGSIYVILSSYSDREKFARYVLNIGFNIEEVDSIYLGGETIYLYKIWRG